MAQGIFGYVYNSDITIIELVEEALRSLYPEMQNARHISPLVLKKTIIGQYREFEQIEHYLHRPAYFENQFLFLLPQSVKMRLVHMYYSFDDAVMREILGKKLTSRSKKDIEDVANKSKVAVTSARRQFENIRRIYKRVEDMGGNLVTNIESCFMLPRQLASHYAYIIFIAHNRLDTSKKKLSQYTFADLEYCASVFLDHWTVTGQSEMQEFDSQLIADIREIKTLLSNKDMHEELKAIVLATLSEISKNDPSIPPTILTKSASNTHEMSNATSSQQPTTFGDQPTAQDRRLSMAQTQPTALSGLASLFSAFLDPSSSFNATLSSPIGFSSPKDFNTTFKTLLRNMISIGSHLNIGKEARDLFLDCVEKIVEPCVAAGWRKSDVQLFFDALETGLIKLVTSRTTQISNANHTASSSLSRDALNSNGNVTSSAIEVRQGSTASVGSIPEQQQGGVSGELMRLNGSWKRLCIGTKCVCLRLFNDISVALAGGSQPQ